MYLMSVYNSNDIAIATYSCMRIVAIMSIYIDPIFSLVQSPFNRIKPSIFLDSITMKSPLKKKETLTPLNSKNQSP